MADEAQKSVEIPIQIPSTSENNDPNQHPSTSDGTGDAKDFNAEKYLKQQIDELIDELRHNNVVPSQLMKQCTECNVTDKDKNTHSLYVVGKYCTYCSSALAEMETPKHFCEICNIYVDGRYCNECQQDLLDEDMKLREIQVENRKQVPLKFRVTDKKETYPKLVKESAKLAESIRNEMKMLENDRDDLKQKGETLELDDDRFKHEIESMNKDIDDLLSAG